MSLATMEPDAVRLTARAMTAAVAAELRAPFQPEQIGKLPRVTCGRCRDADARVCDRHAKSECAACGNYMTGAHTHLDYVGHAAVTDRLLSVDPWWHWEPCAWTDDGLPLITGGVLWIRLNVCGVARLGVGDAAGKKGGDALKEAIGDAIRNAAMRFGVGLDLWSKEQLHAAAPEPLAKPDDVAMLRALMDNIADEDQRRQCKHLFRDAFGLPHELLAAHVADAFAMVDSFTGSAPPVNAADGPAQALTLSAPVAPAAGPDDPKGAPAAPVVRPAPGREPASPPGEIYGGPRMSAKTNATLFATAGANLQPPPQLRDHEREEWRRLEMLEIADTIAAQHPEWKAPEHLVSRRQIGEQFAKLIIEVIRERGQR